MMKDEFEARMVINHFEKELKDAPCSKVHHLNIRGGLLEHLENTLSVAKEYFPNNKYLHFFAMIHDIGKARVYYFTKWGDKEVVDYHRPYRDHSMLTIAMLSEYNSYMKEKYGVPAFVIQDDDVKALKMHHGGWSPQPHITMTPLAVKLHFCDMMATISE